jgi:Pyruvate/2-oxoacid:ferredoxin oxidoreductase delta subunit
VGNNAEWAREIIWRTPYADVVEVVKCKGCKWFIPDENIMPESGRCEYHEMVKMFWDFCSRGKKDE